MPRLEGAEALGRHLQRLPGNVTGSQGITDDLFVGGGGSEGLLHRLLNARGNKAGAAFGDLHLKILDAALRRRECRDGVPMTFFGGRLSGVDVRVSVGPTLHSALRLRALGLGSCGRAFGATTGL